MSIIISPRSYTEIPRRIKGLQLWLDGIEPVTITEETGISKWQDKSGKGNHAVQATGSKQPSYSNSAAVFDGISHVLSIPYTATLNTGDISIFCVAEVSGNANTFRTFLSSRDNAAKLGYTLYARDNNKISAFLGNGSTAFVAIDMAGVLTQDQKYLLNVYTDGTDGYFRVDDSAIGDTNAYAGSGQSNYGFHIGAGGDNGTALFMNGKVYEVLVYNRTLVSQERTNICNYLNKKWSIY